MFNPQVVIPCGIFCLYNFFTSDPFIITMQSFILQSILMGFIGLSLINANGIYVGLVPRHC